MDTQSASASSLSNNHSMHLLKLVVGDVCLRACGLILPIHPSFIQTLWLFVFVSNWSIVGSYLSLV